MQAVTVSFALLSCLRRRFNPLLLLLALTALVAGPEAIAQDKPAPADSSASGAKANSDLGTPFGVVYRLTGEVSALRGSDQSAHALHLGDVTYVGDIIRTGPDAEAVLKTNDAGMIGIRANTEFLAERFSATAKDSDRMTLRIIAGSLRVISGWIGRLHHENYAIRTPAATIGVRGTDHEPYVLAAERAAGTPYEVGSYDKVNSGRTVMTNARGEQEIAAGQVGFARGSNASGMQTRGLMTLLLPKLLDRIPDFYVGGHFEGDLDEYSKQADSTSAEKYKQQQSAPAPVSSCDPRDIAKDWIGRYDKAVAAQNAESVLALFADDATVDAIVREAEGKLTTMTFSRQEFASSTTQALRDLKNFSQRRLTLEAVAMPGENAAACARVYIKSEVLEQGKQSGKPYRFESQEEFVLEQRAGAWRAVHAVVTEH
jgi:ketosteroid isomerase-like protein